MPSRSDVGNAGLLGLLDSHVTPGCRVLEVGCSPGGFLLWCALTRKAHACGVDYAEKSCRQTLQYFADAGAILLIIVVTVMLIDMLSEVFRHSAIGKASFAH